MVVLKEAERVERDVDAVYSLANQDNLIGRKLKRTIDIIEESVRLFGSEGVTISFNGGKDCTVLLHIYFSVLYRLHQQEISTMHSNNTSKISSYLNFKNKKILAIYIKGKKEPAPFSEVENFIESSVIKYNLELETKIYDSMKSSLHSLHVSHPQLKGILIGIRYGDPHAENMSYSVPCDSDWPPFIRINPILDWSYSDVWYFLRQLQVPYCTLYDEGYTSLGHTGNTIRNEALLDPLSPSKYLPAYKLTDHEKERLGRICTKNLVENQKNQQNGQ